MVEFSPLRQLRMGRLPKMVSWYDPRLLARIGVRTIVSSVFGQYADQRLMQAVTDPADDKELAPATTTAIPTPDDPHKCIACDETGAFWIDYIADMGDGFEPTYTMAYLLAQDSLDVRGAGRLRHGEILIMGGDQCYPQATREEYKKRLLQPFNWAFTVHNPDRKLFAIPGNHDWYDGLNAFDSLFCSSRDKLSNAKGNVIGGWQCQQHRSYWALRLPYNWWIWGADIQFSKYLDSSQVNYFEARGRADGPEGQPDHLPGRAVLDAGRPAGPGRGGELLQDHHHRPQARGARVVAVIAGDWHNYNRYYAHELDVHFITSGGGGAFLHPTHVLKNAISVRWPERQDEAETAAAPTRPGVRPGEAWKAQRVRHPPQAQHQGRRERRRAGRAGRAGRARAAADADQRLGPKRKRQPLQPQAPKCYPSKARSYLLSLGNMLFPFYNPGFAIGIGLLYWLITWQFQNARHAVQHLRRQDRRPRHHHVAVERAAVHAALSRPGHDRLDQPG